MEIRKIIIHILLFLLSDIVFFIYNEIEFTNQAILFAFISAVALSLIFSIVEEKFLNAVA